MEKKTKRPPAITHAPGAAAPQQALRERETAKIPAIRGHETTARDEFTYQKEAEKVHSTTNEKKKSTTATTGNTNRTRRNTERKRKARVTEPSGERASAKRAGEEKLEVFDAARKSSQDTTQRPQRPSSSDKQKV